MRLIAKILLPILVIALCVMAARAVIANRAEPVTRPQFKTSTAIEATRLQTQSYTVTLHTRGEVSSANAGSLVAEVAGSITEVADSFVVGGAFRQGDLLAKVDARDYQIALTLARANAAQMQATLAEEQARSEQAALEWRQLGRSGSPSDLTLRKPQLAAAHANLEGALGQVQRAELDLERTNIRARYDGRVRSKLVSLGQYVNPGSSLGDIFSTGSAEIRLPFTSNQLQHIDLDSSTADKLPVKLQTSVGGANTEWTAALVRTEGIDANNRQFYVVAQIDNPYALEHPLRIGQYVEAEVKGNTLNDVFVIPRSSLREDRSVLLVDEIGTLQSRDVVVAWKDAEVAVVSAGLQAGEILNTTALGSVTNGTRVKATIDGVAPQQERRGKPPADKTSAAESPPGNQGNRSGSDNTEGRLQKFKAMIDAGQELPPQAVERIKTRIAAGEDVPAWLKNHIESIAD